MKKWSKLIFKAATLTVLLGGLTACANTAGSADESSEASVPKEKVTLQVGATGQSFPNSYMENDKLVGYDVEVLEAVAGNLGYELEWTTGAFDGLLASLNAGKLDTIANNFAITPERAETVDFTTPYAYTASGIAVKADSAFQSTADLEGATVGGVAGSNKLTELEAYIAQTGLGIEIRQYDTREGPQEDTLKGQVAGYVQDKAVLAATIKKDNLALRILPENIATGKVAFPFAKDEEGEKLRKEFDGELQKLLADGTIKALSEKYYGVDVTAVTE